MLTSLATDDTAVRVLEAAGYRSIFDIARHRKGAFLQALPDLEPARARELHALACQRVATLLSLYRAYVSRNEPVMQGIAKLGIHPRPDELVDAVQRSLGGAPDFHDLFPERSKDGYAEATSIQSLFSPGRYLTELYKVARGLHYDHSPLNLDQRRPDIALLTLSEHNMSRELPTLDILIDVLLEGIARHAQTSISALQTTYYPMTLPYHDNLAQIRSVLGGRDTSLQQVWSILEDAQAQAFSPVRYHSPTDPTANIATPSPPVREDLQLPPATYALLVGDPASAGDIQRDYRLPTDNIASELRTVEVFTDRTALSYNELVGLTGQHDPEASIDHAKSRFYRYGSDTPVEVTEYGQTYLSTSILAPDPLLIVPGQIDYSLIGTPYVVIYPYNGSTRTAPIMLDDIFFAEDGRIAYTVVFPGDTYLLAGNYDSNGQHVGTAESPPTSYTGNPGALVDFAGGAYVEGGQNGAPGQKTGTIRMAPYGPELQLRLTSQNAVTLADRAERLIRLQRQMDLDFHQLDWLIRNANLAVAPERENELLLDLPVLTAAAAFLHLRQTYGISVDEFVCFIGDVNTYAPGSQISLYEKLFSSEAYRVTVPLDATINFDSSFPSDYQSIIAGALGVSTNELFLIAQAAFDSPASVAMDASRYAQLYRAAAIPRMLGISFSQARHLWRMLDPDRDLARVVAGPATVETLAIIRQMEIALLWMANHQLDVESAVSLTTSEYSESVTPDLYNFVQNIYTSLSTDNEAISYHAGQPLDNSLRQKLYSLTAAAFKIKPNVMGRLLQWLDAHFVAGLPDAEGASAPYGLGDYWADIEAIFSQPDADIKDLAGVPNVARYSQAMAQHALIALWAGLTEQDLSLIVEAPDWFIDPAAPGVPGHSLRVLLYISRLKQWQQRVVVPEAEAMGYFKYANAADQTTNDATAMLAYIHGWDLETTRATNRTLTDEGVYPQFPRTFAEVTRLAAWMQVGLKAQVGSSTVAALHRMSWPDETAESSSLIQQVAEQMAATLQAAPNTQPVMMSLKEARRDALVDYYIAYCIPDTPIEGSVPLAARVKNANDLYEYLLIDTKITEAVTTSKVAEAISAVQLYTNRCLEGYDPDVNNDVDSTMVHESRPGGFLYDWPDYNQVYSTWAGKERLQYYPSVYINPGLRYNKTELFTALEETINQGRISDQRIEEGFQQYLQVFEKLAELQTISGYQAGLEASADSTDTLYYVGRSDSSPDYYWRACNMAIRNDKGAITGGAWTQWLKIGAPAAGALDNMVRPCWFQNRLHVGWIGRMEVGSTGPNDGTTPIYQYFAEVWRLQGTGEWVIYRHIPLPEKPRDFALSNNVGLRMLTVSCDYAGTWVDADTTVFQDSMPVVLGSLTTGAVLTGHAGAPDYPDAVSNYTYRWYRADDPTGKVNRILITGQTATTYRLQSSDRNKYIIFEVTPTSAPKQRGSTVTGQVGETQGSAPIVSNLSIAGTVLAGQTLTVNYSFYDADGDLEDTSSNGTQYQWYRHKAGTYLTPIPGATSRTYTMTSADYGPHTLLARVTPRSLTGAPNTGASRDAETGAATQGSAPTVSNLSISGALTVGSKLTVNYTYADADGNPEDTSPNGTQIQWYRHKAGAYLQPIPGASGRSYTLKGSDQGDHSIVARVTPKSTTGYPSVGATTDVQTAVGVTGRAPVLTNVWISGQNVKGGTLTVNYDYHDADGDAEGDTVFQWWSLSDFGWMPGPTGRSYKINYAGWGKCPPVKVEVTPVSRTGVPSTGPKYTSTISALRSEDAAGVLEGNVAIDAASVANPFSISGDLCVGSTLHVVGVIAINDLPFDSTDARFEWFRHKPGEYTVPIPEAEGPSYTLTGSDQGDHCILVKVTSSALSGTAMEPMPLQTAQGVFGTAPTATNLAIVGDPTQVGETLTLEYDYEDADGDLENKGAFGTSYQWLLQTADGDMVPIENATERTFVVTTDAAAQGVVARVTPKSRTGYPNVGADREVATAALASMRTAVWIDGHLMSGARAASSPPVARQASILGETRVGATLLANYEYFDANGDLEDTSASGTQFQWHREKYGDVTPIPGATQRTYTLTDADKGPYWMWVEIVPKSLTGNPNVGTKVYARTDRPVMDWGTFLVEATGWLSLARYLAAPLPIAYLRTDSAVPFSSRLLRDGPSGLLTYETQTELIEHDDTQPIDFDGSYGLYFWEIFFHASFLIADRYLTEQNYSQAQLWSHYIFNPAGYRNVDGELEMIDGVERYWNVVPLQQDATWNVAIPPTVDPDAIAMNDPMHYKVAIFLQSVNTLIERGDNAYRMLQRDYLAQAKMYYLQAAQMLGPRPPIDYKARWPNPSVAQEAGAIAVVDFDRPDAPASTSLTQLLSAYLFEKNGDFLPPYNADLLAYWDKLEVRFYNLRHHLSLDGQPLALPLYAQPVDPRELQRRFGAGNGAGGNSVNPNTVFSQYRFAVLLERAKEAVRDVMDLGRELLQAIDSGEVKEVDILLRTQQQQVLQLTDEIESTQIAILQDELIASQRTLAGAQKRLSHYGNLYQNWISMSEEAAMNMRTTAGILQTTTMPFTMAEKSTELAPNIFGLAVGGAKWGSVLGAIATGLEMASSVLIIAADRLDISEQYRRRRQDWQIERDNAESEVAQLQATIQAQTLHVTMARKQLALSRQTLANEIAVHNLLDAAFTGPALYSWMSGRLAALYYQQYDATLSLCLGCKAALAREIGPGRAHHLFNAPMWNDLYQGLLAGEGLLLELQKMENTYLRDDRRGLEIIRPTSLDRQIQEADANASLAAMVQAALAGSPAPATGGVEVSMLENSKLVIKLSLDALGLDSAYGSNDKTGRLKNISVTLSPETGPDEELEATLGLGGTYVALSHGVDDAGVFEVDLRDDRYLPFEGDPITGTLVLTFFQAGESEAQRALVEQLTDVLYHIRYTLKEY